MFSTLLARFNRSVVVQEEHTFSKNSMLTALPMEVLQDIASLLPLSSAASFTLCSRYTYEVLGTQYSHALRSENEFEERKSFLESLSRDLREWILCQGCLKFHQLIPTNGPKYLWRLKFEPACTEELSFEPLCTDELGFVELAPDSVIKFQDIKQLRDWHDTYIGHKPYPQPLSHTYTMSLPKSTHEVLISARIIDGELFMRMEHHFFMPLGPDVEHIAEHKLKICRHLQYANDRKNALARVIHCKLIHRDNQYCANCSEVEHCKFCETEFLVEYRETKSAIDVLVWRNFGSGEKACDSRWRLQVGVGNGEEMFQHAAACRYLQTPYTPGSIRCAFELQGDKTSKNIDHPVLRSRIASSSKKD